MTLNCSPKVLNADKRRGLEGVETLPVVVNMKGANTICKELKRRKPIE